MRIESWRFSLVVVAAVFLGSVVGSFFMYENLDGEIDSIRDDLSEGQTELVYVNGSVGSLAPLYEKVDDSVVIVNAVGNDASQGSGFVYSRKGYIVTNEHVVDDANRVQVRFSDEKTVEAEILGKDPYTDLAVLKVDRAGLDPLELANSSEVRPGQRAVAMGGPFGLGNSMTVGYVSQVGRSLPVQEIGLEGFRIRDVIQTDAAINPGNSGGPLLNIYGEVIGVNTAIETQTGTFSGIGFAVPSNTVRDVVPEMINKGEAMHPWIGVTGIDMNEDLASEMKANITRGFLVMNVTDDGPADKAGLRGGNRSVEVKDRNYTVGGDIIVGMDGKSMKGIKEIKEFLSRDAEVGEKVNITVNRKGRNVTVPLELGNRPESLR
ncbi:MAG: S1C family serine protease [Candidatus Nanohalobium sp.]